MTILENLPFLGAGKSRDMYAVPGRADLLLIVASNRISTHNIVHLSLIARKGEVLTALVVFWCREVLEPAGIRHHVVAFGKAIYDYLPGSKDDYPDDLHLRAIVVRKLTIDPVEYIYRWHLTGSLYNDYYKKGLPDPYGLDLSPGLPKMYRFDEPIFTPTEKSETDDPLPFRLVKRDYPTSCQLSFRTASLIANHLAGKGITCVDTKEETGRDEEENLYMADEFGTPDCSRFALTSEIREGEDPPWLDKQLARDEAERIWKEKEKFPIKFSDEVEYMLTGTYLNIFPMIADRSLFDFQRMYMS